MEHLAQSIPLLSTANTWTLGQTFSAAPTFGSITGSIQCLHVSSAGLVSGTGADCGAGGGTGANPTAAGNTGAFTLNSTTGLTNSTNDIQCRQGSASQFGCVKVDGSTITASSGVISATGAVSSVTGGIGITVSPTTGSVVVSSPATTRNNTATTDTITSSDKSELIVTEVQIAAN